jgi:hypothetical protein
MHVKALNKSFEGCGGVGGKLSGVAEVKLFVNIFAEAVFETD